MKTYKFIGQLIVDCEWDVQVGDDEDEEQAYIKLIEKGISLRKPEGDVQRQFISVDSYVEDSMEMVWSSELENGNT